MVAFWWIAKAVAAMLRIVSPEINSIVNRAAFDGRMLIQRARAQSAIASHLLKAKAPTAILSHSTCPQVVQYFAPTRVARAGGVTGRSGPSCNVGKGVRSGCRRQCRYQQPPGGRCSNASGAARLG